jgi:hypothetical protein
LLVMQRNREEVKLLKFILPVLALLFVWNYLTCQYCDEGIWPEGGNGTMQECAIHGQNSPITKAFNGISWQVNIYIPGLGCISNDTTPIYIRFGPFKLTITGWFKGFHRVPIMHLRYQ